MAYSKGMWPVVAASRAVVCAKTVVCAMIALVVLAHPGRAAGSERRPVAVIDLDLTAAPAAQGLATELLAELEQHPALRALPLPGAVAALYEPIRDDDAPRLEAAARSLQAAREQLAELDPEQALRFTDTGQLALLTATPNLVLKPYAELAFTAGLALHDLGRLDEARAAFAHAARLDPVRAPDPAGYFPSVIQLYQAAKAEVPAPATLDIRGTGTVWIDGAEVGLAPAAFPVGAGRHVVWLTGVDRETRGERVVVAAGATAIVTITDAEADARTRLQRARTQLARAPDPTARAAAMKRLAALAGVEDAVLISVAGATLIVQTWRAGDVTRAPGFSALRERATSTPAELLAPLAPRAPPRLPVPPVEDPRPFVRPPAAPPRWFQRRTVQASIAITVLGLIVGGYALAARDPGWFDEGWQTDIGNVDPGLGRR